MSACSLASKQLGDRDDLVALGIKALKDDPEGIVGAGVNIVHQYNASFSNRREYVVGNQLCFGLLLCLAVIT